MKIYINPKKESWEELMKRPVMDTLEITNTVSTILQEVKESGDQALYKFTSKLDGVTLDSIRVSQEEILTGATQTPQKLKEAIKIAYNNISLFHQSQKIKEEVVETVSGVKCWRKAIGIEKVGLYIPGGSAPLFSTILMLGIPAQLAGCKDIVLCTPPDKGRKINPAILYTAQLVGVSTIYKLGGAQAIAAMAYGTETVSKVYKIFGPGNQFVTKAKELVQQAGVAIDMPAGPSEVLIVADSSCKPAFVAADLLSQAEHGADSQVILLSDDEEVLNQCLSEVKTQLERLPRKVIAIRALENSRAIILDSISECVEWSNHYAPEHLIIASNHASRWAEKIVNAGSVFVGNYSCESAGDYASGTNHTLPTNGYAKSYSGVSLDSFVKKISFQELTKQGILNIGEAIEIMAEAEELFAHKNAVTLRLND